MSEKKVFAPLASTNHSKSERQVDDYYATDPRAIDFLFEEEEFSGVIWECACGEGHLSKRMIELGAEVVSTDLVDRGYGETPVDFFSAKTARGGHIVSNPPYKLAQQFCEHGLSLLPEGGKMAMFLKLLFLEGQKRKKFFAQYPPKTIYVSSSRMVCAKNGDFVNAGASAVAYAWFVWEKGYTGAPSIKWIN